MEVIQTGTAAASIEGAVWRKSAHSNPSGACVEVARLSGARVAVRDSKDPGGPALVYTGAELGVLLATLKRG